MTARKAALFVIIGLAAVFALRTIATLFPGITGNLPMALSAIGLHLASTLAFLVFFVLFYGLAARQDRESLRQASGVAVIGAGFAVLPPLQTLLQILHIADLTPFGRTPHVELYAPLLASLAFVVFFATYRRELKDDERPALGAPTTAALMGFSVTAILNVIVIALYMRSEQLLWFTEMRPTVAIGSLPIVAASFAAIVYFFAAYSRYQPSE